jgi:aryl-alcohol dehydrogenase-like predicted oxidoreductase
MSNLVKAGKIRYWGVSNYGGWQVATTAMTAKALGAVPPQGWRRSQGLDEV